MDELSVVGQVVGGNFGDIVIRQKAGTDLEIGDLMVSEENGSFLILQVFALEYGSQIQDRMQQMMSGVNLEQGVVDAHFYEPEFVNYVLARIKPLARVYREKGEVKIPKSLPSFFNKLRLISREDLKFLQKEKDSIFVGHIRSGSKVIKEAEVWLPAEDVFSHHMLIPATTGRGKSNLVKTVLWHVLDTNKVGALVLDAHDEYFGRNGVGLKDHPRAKENLVYYTPANPPVGANRLTINLQSVRPEHFEGIVDFSDAQFQAIRMAFRQHRSNWIRELMLTDAVAAGMESTSQSRSDFTAATMMVVQRKLRLLLSLEKDEEGVVYSRHEVFDSTTKGLTTVDDIVKDIESGKVVVLDTSRLGDEAELIVGNIIASKLLQKYKDAKAGGELDRKPVATIVIEEAPRVIGEDVLTSKNDNIYATIAKEGRKFKVGLTAITQLSSVIPRTILANMNTKIILGNEMKQEREAIIASASQDLSEDDKNIASLDKGEAIITSIFVPFAMPIKVPLFEDIVKNSRTQANTGKTKVF
ncbi:DNA double-strand break repair protein Mre11 [Marine Group I thaumarchaeote SCGC RSA3]|uniref:DNA double-strand break repair protein Mre11 n=2 Tax=Marine Group I TaxID=905826 RepID=A0A081RP02_9ARCH|nr:DNA double-strand break repair protein Mre11 [Marine Group I thaumarchaeote SCGC AAA799-N04]KFM17409.1 DNA double-strand break repair protein Mre11 [Marine Group I thaumarchaeote SCGC RSA3]